MRLSTHLLTLFVALTAFTGSAVRAQAPARAGKPAPELFFAIGMGDAGAVKALLAKGANPNATNTIGMSALMIAANTGNLDVVQSLLEAGAQVNYNSPFGSPLLFAAYECKPQVVRLLLARGAEASAQRPDRISVLMLAARAGNPEVLKLVLLKKTDIAATDTHGSTALSYAARMGNTEAARLLLEAGAKVDAADVDGWTPLMHAAVNGHAMAAELLLQKGANPSARDKKGRTPLLLAASFGDHPEAARVLLGARAELEAKDAKGRTALALAETRGFSETAKLLRDRGAQPATAKAAPARTPRQAAETSLRQVEHSMQVFAKRTGCISCHHEGIGRYTTGFAQARGYSINAAFAKEQEKRVLGAFEEMRPLLERAVKDPAETKHVPIVDVGDLAPTNGTLLLGLAEHKTPATDTLGAATIVLARTQTPDGDWRFGLVREPVQSSFFTMTAMAVRAMRTYAPKQNVAEVDKRVGHARQWLLTAPASRTEDMVFRLLGLKWAGATAEERRKAIDELRAAQRPDGGWAQLTSTESDAYATGSALFALAQGGDLSVKDPAYQRGVRFLLRTQDDDGAWYVSKRAIPGNNYFDAEFPYGQSQYASHAAACWATMALILAAEAPGAK
ncbi:MAG: ankyrin repeat domain-containing protein [Actinomycetota bacterium]